jgi:hypothetical protein
MCGLHCRNTRKGIALLLPLPLLFLGCGDFSSEGSDKSGSLFNVESIEPTYFDESTRQVDVFLDNCATDPTEPFDPEPYTDHFADVTLSNRPLTNSTEQTATTIYVTEYTVRYEPLTQGSPELESFTVRPNTHQYGIDACEPDSDCPGETLTQIQFVPVREKEVLAGYIESSGIFQLEYNIYYTFYGKNIYGYDVVARDGTNFYAADYDNCGN